MIWLPDKKKKTIYQAVMKSVNGNELEDLINKYFDPDRYLLCDTNELFGILNNNLDVIGKMGMMIFGNTRRYLNPKYENFVFGPHCFDNDYNKKIYTNPLGFVIYAYWVICSEDEYDLIQLFENLHYYDLEREIREFKSAEKIISELEFSSLGSKTFKEIIQRMWPTFGYFATEILEITDFIPKVNGKVYTLEELSAIKNQKEIANEYGIIVDSVQEKEWINALDSEKKAQSNAKVLSLAKRVNKTSNFK